MSWQGLLYFHIHRNFCSERWAQQITIKIEQMKKSFTKTYRYLTEINSPVDKAIITWFDCSLVKIGSLRVEKRLFYYRSLYSGNV